MLHYDPQHVSSSTLLILRRKNCITTASGIVTLCKQPYSMQVERCAVASSVPLKTGSCYVERNIFGATRWKMTDRNSSFTETRRQIARLLFA